MKLISAAIAVLLLPASASADPSPVPSAGQATAHAPACPPASRLAERYGISFSGFTRSIPAANGPDTSVAGSLVKVAISDAALVNDGFHHSAVINTVTKQAWILRTGGFIGVHEWYGPVDADTASLDQCRLEAIAAAK